MKRIINKLVFIQRRWYFLHSGDLLFCILSMKPNNSFEQLLFLFRLTKDSKTMWKMSEIIYQNGFIFHPHVSLVPGQKLLQLIYHLVWHPFNEHLFWTLWNSLTEWNFNSMAGCKDTMKTLKKINISGRI